MDDTRETAIAPAAASSLSDARPAVRVVIETELGPIEVDVWPEQAPVTVANFLGYVDGGWYDGGHFHRTVHLDNQPGDLIKIEVIQGGVNPERIELPQEPIALERTTVTGLSHRHGTISMARFTVDSATSGFFICINDQPELDFAGRRNSDLQGFAAFGQVVSGMDVVTQIQTSTALYQELTPPIAIHRIRRLA
ncbi:MAG: peptidylprolyl isomerase [Chloroflexota bacterium]|nr:peptidylprolyl isomerase [Chloroflexota bacterium]